jgi:muramoyltetrapeptide carboxypeptidase
MECEANLFPGDVKTIGIVSMSSILPESSLVFGTNYLVQCGYCVKTMPNVRGPQVAPAEVRARLFEKAWMDPEIDVLLFARGGDGAADVVGLVDWDRLRARDMRVIGFSDVTLVLNTMLSKGVGHPYSGPMLSYVNRWNSDSREWFSDMLNGAEMRPVHVRPLKPGRARGLPMGGHVMRMRDLCAMGLAPSARGRVVFFECTAKHHARKVIAGLEEMRDRGNLDGAAAVVFADFRHTGDERRELDAFFPEFAKSLQCPVFADFPYGHIDGILLLDFRREVSISQEGELRWASTSK